MIFDVNAAQDIAELAETLDKLERKGGRSLVLGTNPIPIFWIGTEEVAGYFELQEDFWAFVPADGEAP